MPNWCNNYIRISGTPENMKPIYEFFEPFLENNNDMDTLVMNTLVPHDKDYKKIQRTNDYILNPQDRFYGTKWDFNPADMSILDVVDELVAFSVNTAWSPPEPFCKRLSKKYGVKVYIKYEEGGCDFCGFAEFDNGKQIESKTYSYLEGLYHLEKDNFWDEVDSYAQSAAEDEEPLPKFLNYFKFITNKDDIAELTEVYHIHISEQN